MTLLVGAIFPWKHLLEYPAFQALRAVQPARGVIIAADSRWTFPNGRTEDGAVKVFGIGTNAVCAYAGNAIAGEDAIMALGKKVPSGRSMEEWSRNVQTLIREAWQAHQPANKELHILMGFSFASGYAWLGHFGSNDGFTAHEVDDMLVIGPDEACTFFRQTLRAATVGYLRRIPTEPISLSIENWAMLVTVAVNEACELQAHESVGGKILSGLTILGKPQGVGVVRLAPPSAGSRLEHLTLGGAGQTLRPGFFWDADNDGR